MGDWDPALYTRFEAQRTRPAVELLARVPLDAADVREAVDLGCGPGNSTALVAARYPGAAVTGIDRSPAMIEAARQRLPGLRFEPADIAAWAPQRPPQLIFANAALQWLPDQEQQLQRLFGLLAPGGVLAVQVPDNLDEPSHRLMRETAAAGPWAALIGDAHALRAPRLAAERIYDLLAPAAEAVDVWHTVYRHPMPSARAIVDWLRSTGLRPFLDPLDAAGREAFVAAYEARIAAAYPPRADGQRLLAFPRLFHVSRRRR
ncbi:MAG: trans-aconitate 2-methyltransferase [Rubrivivax sp.]|nr:trans-aconitate 2-methyltransferase [Pseudomonadota bacterium]MCW5638765.1 trans-aconitate 2-methyltransferase [Rubrivivax sp.]